MSAEHIIEHPGGLAAEDAAVIENVLNYYLSCNEELKEVLRRHAADPLQRMAGIGFLTRKLLGPLTKAVVTATAEGLFASDPEDYGVGWELRENGAFGTAQLETYSALLPPAAKVLVIGAHIGTLAIPLSHRCAYVAAIEANPDTYSLLEMNVRLNNVQNCDTFHIAANDKAEALPFLLSRANSGGSKRRPQHSRSEYDYDDPEEITVTGIPLDDFFTRRDFDLILMDIEGSEYFALKGMQDILQHARTLVTEFLPHHLRHVSAVGVDELLAQIPDFRTLTVPSLQRQVTAAEFAPLLHYMYDNNLGDEGIIFER
ncbi:FkbM family methyltransferase [Chitinophaga solisilvae]|uniref:FkbM family methyltransferase n=1 Tax=Chitinophaga solisilvae TaxID=1233460 RepID=UPI001369B724|nr:FkbM family methyltransferase [Chitinophaga solisilvae]